VFSLSHWRVVLVILLRPVYGIPARLMMLFGGGVCSNWHLRSSWEQVWDAVCLIEAGVARVSLMASDGYRFWQEGV